MNYSNYVGCDIDGGGEGFALRALLDKIKTY